MPSNRTIKEMQKNATVAQGQVTPASPKSGRKTPGTRLGIAQDWREGSNKDGKTSIGIGKTIRDGR